MPIYCAINSPLLIEVLNIMLRYSKEHLKEAMSLLREIQAETLAAGKEAA